MRARGRGNDELREVTFQPGFTRYAEGSVLATFGATMVLCNATVDESVPGFLMGKGQGWLTAEYSLLPRSTHTRTQREATRGHQGGRTLEIQRLIGRSLRGIVDMRKLGERTVTFDCDVLQADGGTRTASITGAYVALQLAVKKMLKQGVLKQSPVLDAVAAVSAGMVGGVPMVDLDYSEDSEAEVDLNLVLTGAGKIVEIQGTGEKRAYSQEELQQMISLAQGGIERLHRLQREALEKA